METNKKSITGDYCKEGFDSKKSLKLQEKTNQQDKLFIRNTKREISSEKGDSIRKEMIGGDYTRVIDEDDTTTGGDDTRIIRENDTRISRNKIKGGEEDGQITSIRF